MDLLTGAVQIVAVVIAVGGLTKLISPDAFAALLTTLGVPGGVTTARITGVVEVALGAATVLVGGRLFAALVAAAYAVFTVAVLLARRAGAPSCGCFGASASPPSVVHVVVNSISALIALSAAMLGDLPSLISVLETQPWAGVPYLVAVAMGAWLTVTLDTVGAEVFDSIAEVAELGPTFRENSSAATPTARTVTSDRSGGSRR